ncbi:MAG TPA: LysR substrate-binding domain-containing protein [Micromonospora sp.]|nr:LysR substrate-binding domain-containing protein [Micromonospora sp.]
MTMRLQQLRCFVAVAQRRHFTHAAIKVGVTQPSLSKQIHRLEAELGAPLFSRIRSNVTLTPAGEALLPIATRILADIETARREVQEIVGVRRGRVRLGVTPSLCTSLLPPVLRRFRAEHPQVDLRIEEGGSRHLVRNLRHGELDLAMIVQPSQGVDPSLRAEPILRERLVVVSVAPLAVASPQNTVRIADLRDESLVMFRTGYDLREVTLQACREAGFEPSFAVEGGEMDAVLSFVEAGLGVAVVPGNVVSGRPRLRATPLAPPGVLRTIALAHRREADLTHAATAMQTALLTYLTDAAREGSLPSGLELV